MIGLVLRRQLQEGENPCRESEPGWDSLKHVELVFLLEDYFNVRFTEADMAELNDASSIVRALEEKRSGGEPCDTV